MPDCDQAIKIVDDYERGNLTWDEAFKKLLTTGLIDYIIREAIGDEPEI